MVCFAWQYIVKKALLCLTFLVILLAACQPQAAPPSIAPTVEPLPGVTSAPPTATASAQPTQNTTSAPGFQLPTPTPMRIDFPTPQEPPVSIWRAPLYQLPFALGPFDHFYFSRPIEVDAVNWPLADYRYGYFFPGTDVVHTGIDIDAPLGTPIVAAASGRVIWAGYGLLRHNNDSSDPYGIAVAIRHDFGFHGLQLTTIYAHMSRVDVRVGEKVEQGDQLGIVGITGQTTGPHVHFEVRMEGNSTITTRNPELWLAPPEGDGVITGRVMRTNGLLLQAYKVKIVDGNGDSWAMYTYASNAVNPDDYYSENMVLSDLPAGEYTVQIIFERETYEQLLTVRAGAIAYFTFQGTRGFTLEPPAVPGNMGWLIPYGSQ